MKVSAPGRICLFGEHQDYLGLPVIAMAVNLRFEIEFHPEPGPHIEIQKPDLGVDFRTTFDPYGDAPTGPDDFCWGITQILREEGFEFPHGGRAIFRSRIPLRAGCSSSSAMSAAWMRLLLEIGEHPRRNNYIQDSEQAAYLVYRGEKEKFQGAGGMMDQYSCYLGGLIQVFPRTSGSPIPFGVERLPEKLGGIILIDSGDPKDTQGILSSVGQRARQAVQTASREIPGFDLTNADTRATISALGDTQRQADHWQVVVDHLRNRDLCREGLAMFRSTVNGQRLGEMLTEEHRILSQTLGISTPKIDHILDIVREAGAAGGKINGSGGGGTCFCYAPDPAAHRRVTEKLTASGIRHFCVTEDEGARRDD
jgi:galactokinase